MSDVAKAPPWFGGLPPFTGARPSPSAASGDNGMRLAWPHDRVERISSRADFPASSPPQAIVIGIGDFANRFHGPWPKVVAAWAMVTAWRSALAPQLNIIEGLTQAESRNRE